MVQYSSIPALRRLEAHLLGAIEQVSIRGLEDGPFLFATHHGRAIEVSTNDTDWWIEFWENTGDPDASAIRDQTVNSESEALRLVLEWLQNQA